MLSFLLAFKSVMISITAGSDDVKAIQNLHELIIARQIGYVAVTGKVVLIVRNYSKSRSEYIPLDNPVTSFHTKYQIWQTRDSYRNNFFAIVPNPNDRASGYDQIICQNCERKNYLVKFSAHPLIGMEFSENEGDSRYIGAQGYDLRTIGIIAMPFPNGNTFHTSYYNRNLRHTIGSFAAHDLHDFKRDDLNRIVEHSSNHKIYKYRQLVRFSYIDDEPYLAEVTTRRPDGNHVYEGHYKYSNYRKAGNTGYYPAIINYESLIDGNLESTSTTTIDDVIFNDIIPDDIFSFKTMHGLNGKLVSNNQNGKVYRYVDGVMIDANVYEDRIMRAKESPPTAPQPIGEAPEVRLNWLYAVAAFVLAVVAVFFLHRALRR